MPHTFIYLFIYPELVERVIHTYSRPILRNDKKTRRLSRMTTKTAETFRIRPDTSKIRSTAFRKVRENLRIRSTLERSVNCNRIQQ